jgi:hypothetical protein
LAVATLALLLGALLCFAGALSVRMAILAAGFGVGWLLAEVFDASWGTALLVGLAGAAAAWLCTLVLASVLMFVEGAVIGALVGAKLFVIADRGHSDGVLAIVFVPTVAVLCGLLANHWRYRFLMWATAIAGAGLLLSGLGRLGADSTRLLWRPESTGASAVFTIAWVALAVIGHNVQRSSRAGRAHAG